MRELLVKFLVWLVEILTAGQYELIQLYQCDDCNEVLEAEDVPFHKCMDIIFVRDRERIIN